MWELEASPTIGLRKVRSLLAPASGKDARGAVILTQSTVQPIAQARGLSASYEASWPGNSSCFPATLLIPLAEPGEPSARLLSHQQQPKITPEVGFTATCVLGRYRDLLHPADVLDFRLCDAQVSLSTVIPSFFLYGFIPLSGWIFCLAGTLPWDLPQFETSLHICT